MGSFRDREWDKHEQRGHMWGDVVPPHQSVMTPDLGPMPQKPKRKVVYRSRKKQPKVKTDSDMTPDDVFKHCMELSQKPEEFIAYLNKWLDEPRFADRETEGKNMLVDKSDWHGAFRRPARVALAVRRATARGS